MTPKLKIHTNVSLNEDIQATTGVDGHRGWIRINNGFNDYVDAHNKINIGRSEFTAEFDIEATQNFDNSVDYVVRNLRFTPYNYTKTGNSRDPDIKYFVTVHALENGQRRQIWSETVTNTTSTFSRANDFRSDVVWRGRIQPREDLQAYSDPIWIVGYVNDADKSTKDDRIDFAFQVVNDLPPTVSPWAKYDCERKKWLTTNRENGGAWRYDCTTGTWRAMKTIDQGKAPVKLGVGRFDCNQDKFVNQSQIGVKE